ncbi:hypothetical protein C8Q80DRAFT_1277848 [Daedaleopsis nitida]|nr:hypothetical protein C8Q80DRAFT_1277848 [Daedaleopsis nitida]
MNTTAVTDTAIVVSLSVLFRGCAPGEDIAFSDIDMALLQLEHQWPFVITLSIKLAGTNLPTKYLHPLLKNRMPSLRKLMLQGVHPAIDVTDYLSVPFDHYNYDSFGPEIFPLAPPVPEWEHTEFYMALPPASIPEFAYEDFLDALTRLSSLSRLEVRNFLHVPTTTLDSIPSSAEVARRLPKLSTLIIHDKPGRIQFFLPYLTIPHNANVRLFALCNDWPLEGDILREMLPMYPATLATLGQVDRVSVKIGPGFMSVAGTVSSGNTRRDGIVLSCTNTPTVLDNRESRVQLLQLVIQRTVPDIFHASKLTYLSVQADDVSVVTLAWASILDPSQNLTSLIIRDTAQGAHGPCTALFAALGERTEETYPGSGQTRILPMLCPQLQSIRLVDIRYPILEKDKDGSRYSNAVELGPGRPGRRTGLRPLKAHNGSLTNGGNACRRSYVSPAETDPLFKALEWREEAGFGLVCCQLVDVSNDFVPADELQRLVNNLAKVVESVSLKNRANEQTYLPVV